MGFTGKMKSMALSPDWEVSSWNLTCGVHVRQGHTRPPGTALILLLGLRAWGVGMLQICLGLNMQTRSNDLETTWLLSPTCWSDRSENNDQRIATHGY